MEERYGFVVGISEYQYYNNLKFATADAHSIASFLSSTEGGNFSEVELVADEEAKRAVLRKKAQNFFSRPAELLVFYFAGHGLQNMESGILVTYDGEPYDEGIAFRDLTAWTKTSPAKNIVIIMDCCHSGAADIRSVEPGLASTEFLTRDDLRYFETSARGRVLLASSSSSEKSREDPHLKHGVFTYFFLEACKGNASNSRGHVTVASIHSYISSQMKLQTPVFKGTLEGDIVISKFAPKNQELKLSFSKRIVHPLPPAPFFSGRKNELNKVIDFVSNSNGVLSLVGIGGAGKTALAERALREILSSEKKPQKVFVWSFYQDQSTNFFLQECYRYLEDIATVEITGYELLYRLTNKLASGDDIVLVLDGLETMQQPRSDSTGIFGQVVDPFLRRFIKTLAGDAGKTRCVITSRFDLSDLKPWEGQTYFNLEINDLEVEDAKELLKIHGVQASSATFNRLFGEFGTHALTIDFLGGYIKEFCRGDANGVFDLQNPTLTGESTTERKLAKILRAYRQMLTETELALIARVCVFRFGINADDMYKIFVEKGTASVSGILQNMRRSEFNSAFKRLVKLHLINKGANNTFFIHPAVKDFFAKSFTQSKEVHSKIADYYSSLIGQPGKNYPTDKNSLDLLEELIYHTIEVENIQNAIEIYTDRLGGVKHLGWNLGEFDRGKRILELILGKSSFFIFGTREMAIYMRALGSLSVAAQLFPSEAFTGMIWILNGNFSKVLDISIPEYENVKEAIQFLRGNKKRDISFVTVNCMIIASDIEYFSSVIKRKYVEDMMERWSAKNWQDDVARAKLILAEYSRLGLNFEEAHNFIQSAAQWIINSGSQEHLCLLYHTQAKLACDKAEYKDALRLSKRAYNIALECNLGLYMIDIMMSITKIKIKLNQVEDAVNFCVDAYNLAHNQDCRHVRAEVRACQLKAECLIKLESLDDAEHLLINTLSVQESGDIGNVEITRDLIKQINSLQTKIRH